MSRNSTKDTRQLGVEIDGAIRERLDAHLRRTGATLRGAVEAALAQWLAAVVVSPTPPKRRGRPKNSIKP